MNPRRVDAVAALVVAGILAVGGLLTWDAYRARQAFEEMNGGMMGSGGMMGGMMGATAPDPGWYLLVTLVVAGVVGAAYYLLREDLVQALGESQEGSLATTTSGPTAATPNAGTGDVSTAASTDSSGAPRDDSGLDSQSGVEPSPSADAGAMEGEAGRGSAAQVLSVLPEDERRILEPVIESPGLTQIALRDRADFSKSKVSQTVSDLEKRGLLYRERQGRTYRVYPADELEAGSASASSSGSGQP
ncbi:MAG: helix-turn-helix transcriptional regulator [Halodesulfurarchaeum sp.]